ncbi:response regulator [soil metagenome]
MRAGSSTNRTVLLVDDDADNLRIYASILRVHGYSVLEARTGAEALPLARGQPLDLVVMDLKMPQLDGWKTLELLRDDEATKHLPVIALTVIAPGEDRRDPLSRGFDAHWVKPLSPTHLLERVQQWIGGAERGTAASS